MQTSLIIFLLLYFFGVVSTMIAIYKEEKDEDITVGKVILIFISMLVPINGVLYGIFSIILWIGNWSIWNYKIVNGKKK